MPVKVPIKFLPFVLITVVILSLNVPKAEAADQQDTNRLKIRYFDIDVQLIRLDLVTRRVSFNLSGNLGLNFSATSESYDVTVATLGSNIGHTKIRKNGAGETNSSSFKLYANESSFEGYFKGGPETYPFDRYKFNFTLSIHVQTAFLEQNNITFHSSVAWSLMTQFDEPSEHFASVVQNDSGPIVSVGFTLNRPEWRGYATLLPIYLIFALLGFSALIKTQESLTNRIAVYAGILTSALAYSISVQNTLPPGRYYLSIPEALVYSIIASATVFIIMTSFAYRTKASQALADAVAAVISQAFLSFLILTLYFAKYVEIDTVQISRILYLQYFLAGLLLGGVYLSLLLALRFDKDRDSKTFNDLHKEIVKGSLWVSLVLLLSVSCITAYERLIHLPFSYGFGWQLILDMAGDSVPMMILLQAAAWSGLVCILFYAQKLWAKTSFTLFSRRFTFAFLGNVIAFLLTFHSMFTFLLVSFLAYGDSLSVFVTSLLLAIVLELSLSLSSWRSRRRLLTPYEWFVSWYGL